MIIRGRARKFGDNIDTDTITSGSLLHLATEELAQHAFEPIAPDFAKSVREGDIIIGGNNFGCGSSREQATAVVKQLGIRYVVAESMARIYMRNCVALGLYPVISKGVSGLFAEGDEIEIDFEKGEVRNPKTGKKAAFEPLSGGSLEIVNAGGILATLKKRMAK
jgi:3-isopropylmalate dehydratase small subunit